MRPRTYLSTRSTASFASSSSARGWQDPLPDGCASTDRSLTPGYRGLDAVFAWHERVFPCPLGRGVFETHFGCGRPFWGPRMGRCSFLRRESRAWTFSRRTADGNKERLRPPPATFARLSFAPLTPPCAPPGTAGASPQRPRHTVSHDISRSEEERSAHCWGPPGGGGSAAPPPSSPPCTRPQRDTAARRKDALLISRPLQPVPLATRATRSSTPPPPSASPVRPPFVNHAMYIHVLPERVAGCTTAVLAPLAARRDCRRRAHTPSAIASSVYSECLPICPVPRSPPPRGQ